jgi:hemoglobin/transferrin/lactoferrin receptor protein
MLVEALFWLLEDGNPPQEPPADTQRSAEVLVTAPGFGQDPLEAPYSTSEIGLRELRSLYRTVPEALGRQPGVMVQKTAHGQSSPYIRGFTGFRNLLLVDGVRLNHSVFRDGPNQYWSTIDPLTVERLELLRPAARLPSIR